MATFKDQEVKDADGKVTRASREWTLQLDRPSILAIREDCDPRFMLDDGNEDDNTCTRLDDDDVLLCRVIYLLTAKQREARNVDEEQFYLDVIGNGETIQAAGEAMLAAIVNFTRPRKRKWVEAVAQKTKAMEDLAIAKALAKMDDPALAARLEASMDAQMDAAIDRALTPPKSAPSSPDSSESTPSV